MVLFLFSRDQFSEGENKMKENGNQRDWHGFIMPEISGKLPMGAIKTLLRGSSVNYLAT